jgi:hypothetical protein
MKRICLFIFVAFVCNSVLLAQDVITLRSGDEIKAKVQEIGTDNVKYKKYENLNGPTYTLLKSEIFMIKYENGDRDIFKDTVDPNSVVSTVSASEPPQNNLRFTSSFWSGAVFMNAKGKELSKREVRSILADVPEALKEYDAGRKLFVTSCVIGGISGGFVGAGVGGLITGLFDTGTGLILVGSGVGGIIITGIVAANVNSKWEKAYNLYQRAKSNPYAMKTSLHFGLTRSGGIGLTLTF